MRRLLIAALLVGAGVLVAPPAHASPPPAECPAVLHCVYTPAAYHNNNPADPVDYGNYDLANRPADGMAINSVVIHDTEGTCQGTIDALQDPTFYVSAHYLVCRDGTVHQLVRLKDVAWHAGNWWQNMHSIGIEHEGFAATGNADYTPAMYAASAILVRWLASRFGFAPDRQHVIGHDNVPQPRANRAMHVDPGPFWNWQAYLALLGQPVLPGGNLATAKMVTVAPNWWQNKPPVTGCWNSVCVPAGAHSANLVYLRTTPDASAPLLTDPEQGAGSTDITNTAARATYGQKFVVADRQVQPEGIWLKVWYGGQAGWFFSPYNAPTAVATYGTCVKPKVGNVATYGLPVPEASEYPADFVPPAGALQFATPLAYTVQVGQCYAVTNNAVPTDWYFAWTFDSRLPYDHTRFVGATQYVQVQLGNRLAYVKKSEVTLAA